MQHKTCNGPRPGNSGFWPYDYHSGTLRFGQPGSHRVESRLATPGADNVDDGAGRGDVAASQSACGIASSRSTPASEVHCRHLATSVSPCSVQTAVQASNRAFHRPKLSKVGRDVPLSGWGLRRCWVLASGRHGRRGGPAIPGRQVSARWPPRWRRGQRPGRCPRWREVWVGPGGRRTGRWSR